MLHGTASATIYTTVVSAIYLVVTYSAGVVTQYYSTSQFSSYVTVCIAVEVLMY